MTPLGEDFTRLRHHVQAALEHNGGTYAMDEVERRIADGRFRVWATDNAIVLTEICRLPSKTLLNIALGGGELEQVKDLVLRVEGEAKDLGCVGVSIIGRRGWGKALDGYREAATVYMKEL